MELNWLVIGIVVAAAIALIVFLIWRNQKDKNELMKKLIEEEEASMPKEPDKDNDIAD